ncbi:hypothetical protein NA57DRAFT_81046 [Rhizodiscina lignyota]|uniref:Uncharacterized protein n=1 Tax=Rhizodiscina lignyota TaxID=1504668 RepID=A0A9P4I6W8_9PEZI|nr:hypothetical protein NA57DRAFT_81046 [Rhizodiscina lignyota]
MKLVLLVLVSTAMLFEPGNSSPTATESKRALSPPTLSSLPPQAVPVTVGTEFMESNLEYLGSVLGQLLQDHGTTTMVFVAPSPTAEAVPT